MLDALKVWLAHYTRLPVRLNVKPDSPDALVVLTEYGGVPVRGMDRADRDVQMLFRGPSAAADAWRVYKAIAPSPPVVTTREGGKFVIRPKQSPFYLDRDVLERVEYVLNVAVMAAPD
jgi:hypothetical protein